MSLIKCSECGKEISDQASACPGCGAPPVPKWEPRSKELQRAPILGIIAAGLGLSSIIVPYFAAVFFVPASIICSLIAYRRGQKVIAFVAVILGLVGLVNIIYVSQKIYTVTNSFETTTSISNQSTIPPIVTKAEYDQLAEGMSYEQVITIIGKSGKELSRSDLGDISTVMYSWANSDGSNMNAIFQNGSLVNKAQMGLQ